MASPPPSYSELELPPPSYVKESMYSVAMEEEEAGEKDTQEVEIEVAMYTVSVNLAATGDKPKWAAHGLLQFGMMKPLGVLQNYVAYQPAADYADPDSDPQWENISDSIEVINDLKEQTETHYIKNVEPIKTPWAFDLVVGAPKSGAKLAGTYTDENCKKWAWAGRCTVPSMVIKIHEKRLPDIPKPPGVTATINDFAQINPFAWESGDGFKRGDDVAQIRGDEMWQKISLHALPPAIKQRLFRDLQPLTPPEETLLKKYPEFFKRFSVHEMAERLKKTDAMPTGIKNHIQYKKYWFLQMMTSYVPPKKESNKPDPVVQYGWDREKNKKELTTLQTQYMGVAMDCYEAGYISFRSDWTQFLEHAEYWYQMYDRYLVSEGHLKPWLAKLPSRKEEKGAMPVPVEVMHWGNKLSLLKRAVARVDKAKADTFDVEKTTKRIATAAALHFTYAQVLDEHLITQMREILKRLKDAGDKYLEELEGMTDAQKELYNEMKLHGLELFEKLTSEESPLRHLVEKWANQHGPPTPTPKGLIWGGRKHFTLGQFSEVLERLDLEKGLDKHQRKLLDLPLDALEREYVGIGDLARFFNPEDFPKGNRREALREWLSGLKQSAKDGLKNLGKKLKSLKWWCTKFLTSLHFVAVTGLVTELMKNSAHMSSVQLAMYIMQVTVIGSEWLLFRTGRWIMLKVYAAYDVGRKVTGSIVKWLTNTLPKDGAKLFSRFRYAFIGNVYKVIRLVGFACTILGLIATHDELEKARELNENDARIYTIFNRISFSLQIFEVIMITGEIVFEGLGMTAMSSLCGILGCVAGIVGIIAVVIYMVWFAPNPWTFATNWLEDEGKKFGAYDPNKEDVPEKEPGIQLPDPDKKGSDKN
ncbi:polyprotein 1 [Fusarium austroafricanum]|uniref:Polyprotein 1 n=1 Tax=Fusarium austroafricanum TaxID=2364996 RepID=A0A8H4NVK8_9HYPO|nr:polyprotein 1 [Fusarium austroafricanum]